MPCKDSSGPVPTVICPTRNQQTNKCDSMVSVFGQYERRALFFSKVFISWSCFIGMSPRFLSIAVETKESNRLHAVYSFLSHGARRNACICLLRRGTLSAGTHSRRTTETMVVRSNSNISQVIEGINVKDGLSPLVDAIDTHSISKLLVEITIVNLILV